MKYQQLLDEIRKLNLNEKYINPNHDTKLVNFFYNLQKSNELDLIEVRKALEVLTNEFSEDMKENIGSIAYFVSLIET
ncbi:MAG: hypothetical protein EPO37_01460 [Nitrosarchaeum sp.]|nr:MAG: hypothetical protein EPO37_01460 [Nitrosarchaeum sp.]